MGVSHYSVGLCDTLGVIYRGRGDGMNQWKSAHAVETELRTLAEAMAGADVCIGLSVKGAFTPAMIGSMAVQPIIFAMANPDPEITPEEIPKVRAEPNLATRRPDSPTQTHNTPGL